MLAKPPDIAKLKADKNERKLIKALGYKAGSAIRAKAANAIGVVGSVAALEPLCSLFENDDELIEIRVEAVSAVGKISAWIMKLHQQTNSDSVKPSEARRNAEENSVVFKARTRLRKIMKDGPEEIRLAAAQACMNLPLTEDSAVTKAFKTGINKNTDGNVDNGSDPDVREADPVAEKEKVADTEHQVEDSAALPESNQEPKTEQHIQNRPNEVKREISMHNPDLDKPVEIAPNTYWVGRRDDTLLERNIYLRIFKNGDKTINLLIDPGPPEDLTPLVKKLSSLIGGIRNLNIMFLNHQDPDVSYNSGHLQKLNPNCVVLCSEDSWRLAKFYGLDPKKYKAVESFKDMSVVLSTGHKIRFVPTPYCHFRGAVMLYDEETGVLFSGDFLGGLSFNPDLYATEDSWDGVATFHQIYMPSQAALKHAVSNIRELDKTPGIIAPQHGSILTGDLVSSFLGKVENLEVGLDLFLKDHNKKNYISALNELLAEFSQIVDSTIIPKALSAFRADGSFPNAITVGKNGVTDIKVDAQYAIEIFLRELRKMTPADTLDLVDISIVRVLTMWKIPLPEFMLMKSNNEDSFFEA
ncbi:MAG: hypothetical protein KAS73_00740 [Candidatus Sabulitectum sp.]|nr:hypothetical protein [Candidatus Sabulitectum sp.]